MNILLQNSTPNTDISSEWALFIDVCTINGFVRGFKPEPYTFIISNA